MLICFPRVAISVYKCVYLAFKSMGFELSTAKQFITSALFHEFIWQTIHAEGGGTAGAGQILNNTGVTRKGIFSSVIVSLWLQAIGSIACESSGITKRILTMVWFGLVWFGLVLNQSLARV